ncbi:hypothetical protein [Pontibacter russatus]|uniref:hypothetical protein n=1 Tax=Pontibacter russatus TaxID=2694929 RepID=UPI00137AA2A2|nr:hypothetical protein [Pontibacter russatus]
MRPEEIDKLFKERLGNTAPTPPADLWGRLQERMQTEALSREEEEVKVVPLQSEKKKSNYIWLYPSIAAAVSLVLSVGVVFYNINNGTPEVSEALAGKNQPLELHEQPATAQAAPETMAQAAPAEAETTAEENISTSQATDPTSTASNGTEAVAKPEAIAKAAPKAIQPEPAKAIATAKPEADAQPAIAVNVSESAAETHETAPQPAVKPATPAALAKAAANLNAEPVEIIIKRSVASPPAMAEAAPKGLGKKAKLAKGIFRQVRNLANGDGVELSEVGINADKVALNTQIGNQKFSKVINL